MSTLVSYELEQCIATIRMDDGKVNVLSPAMQSQLNAALDQAEAAGAVVVLSGRTGVFTAGLVHPQKDRRGVDRRSPGSTQQ